MELSLTFAPVYTKDFRWTLASDFRPTFELLRTLQFGPFAPIYTLSAREIWARYSTEILMAGALLLAVLVHLVLLNVLVSQLTKRFPLKLDLTPDGMYEISDESINYLRTLDQDVNFTVLMAESSFQTGGTNLKMISELLEKYSQYSDRVSVRYVDPNTNPDVVNQFQANYSGSLSSGDIVISNAADPSKLRVVNVGNLFSYDQQKYMLYYYYKQGSLEDCITGFTGEQNLTAALMYVTDADPVHVAVLATGNEQPLYNQQYNYYSLSMFEQTLTKNGYDVQEIDLYKDALDPAQYDMLVLPAPVNDLTATAIDNTIFFITVMFLMLIIKLFFYLNYTFVDAKIQKIYTTAK